MQVDFAMPNSIVTVDPERQLFTLVLSRGDYNCILAVLQWMIGHFSDKYIDTGMLLANREQLRSLNRCMMNADIVQAEVRLVLEIPEAHRLQEVLSYAEMMLLDEPLLPESVRGQISAVVDWLRPSLTASFNTLSGRFPGLG